MPTKKQRLLELKGDWTASRISISYERAEKIDVSITGLLDVYPFLIAVWDKELINIQEQLMALFLNIRGKVIAYRVIGTGSMESCSVNIRLIASLALHTMASSVILAHNHPSGNLIPSDADIALTIKTKKALQLVDVKLLDHYIITDIAGFSMAAHKLI